MMGIDPSALTFGLKDYGLSDLWTDSNARVSRRVSESV